MVWRTLPVGLYAVICWVNDEDVEDLVEVVMGVVGVVLGEAVVMGVVGVGVERFFG